MAHHCLNCEAAEMVLETKDVTVSYKHLSAVVPAVTGWYCPHCGEIEFTDETSSRRHMDALQEAESHFILLPLTVRPHRPGVTPKLQDKRDS